MGLLATATAIGGSFQFGLNLTLINSPTKAVQEFINATWLSRHGEAVTPDGLLLLWSLIVAAYTAGGLLGALLAGPLAVRVGRRNGLLASNAFAMAASLMLGFSRAARSFELLVAGRLLMGIDSGIGMSLQPMYLGESALQRQRGALTMTTVVFCTFGLIVGQLVGLKQVLGEPHLWPLALALPALPAALQLLALPWLPESPRHLLLDRHEPRRALAALRWLRGGDGGGSVEREMEQMEEEERSVQARSVLDLIRDPRMRRQIAIIVALNILQQFSGINVIYFYATSLFAQAGISDEEVPFVTLGTGIAEAVTTLVFGLTIDLLGRRPLLICGFGLTSVCSILITVCMLLQVTITWLSYVSVGMLFAFIICFALGPAGIISILPAELFMQSERPAAFVIAGAANWGSFIIISVVFPFLMESLGPFCFLLFSADCLLAAALVHRWLPETKNRSLLEIARHFEAVGRGHGRGGLAGTGAGGGLAGDATGNDATTNDSTANDSTANDSTGNDDDDEEGPPPTTQRGVTELLTKL